MKECKSCPFCGSDDTTLYARGRTFYVRCRSCKATMPGYHGWDAIDNWNKRDVILKACPFCNSPAYSNLNHLGNRMYMIKCTSPDCFAIQYGMSPDEVIKRWNKRG